MAKQKFCPDCTCEALCANCKAYRSDKKGVPIAGLVRKQIDMDEQGPHMGRAAVFLGHEEWCMIVKLLEAQPEAIACAHLHQGTGNDQLGKGYVYCEDCDEQLEEWEYNL